MIRDENGLLAGYVYVDMDTAGATSAATSTDAKRAVAAAVKLPPGYSLVWSGQYENMVRVRERLKVVLPITLLLIFVLLYLNTEVRVRRRTIVMLAVPFSAVGAVWLLYAARLQHLDRACGSG